ncbi:MAG: DUF2189 domain-containing protein [Azospirillaceae bacterium]
MAIAAPAEITGTPSVRRIGTAALRTALVRGLDDFRDKPSHLLFIGIIYPIAGLILSRLVFGYEILPLLFPLAAGFALLGPFAAIGLYELSRRREQGQEVGWRHAFGVLQSPAIRQILILGAILAVTFVAWLLVAWGLYAATLGTGAPQSIGGFLDRLFTTGAGWTLIVVGNAVGALFAVFALTISVVSFPLLLDRHVGVATAIATSAKAVAANPGPMAAWGLIVAAGLVIGSIPLFVGLAVVMPILGHATWHLYRQVVGD